jgi:hypothetical protein
MSGTHECPAPGCGVRVPFAQFACRSHWYSLPAALRSELLLAWRRNPISQRYLDARAACVAYLER